MRIVTVLVVLGLMGGCASTGDGWPKKNADPRPEWTDQAQAEVAEDLQERWDYFSRDRNSIYWLGERYNVADFDSPEGNCEDFIATFLAKLEHDRLSRDYQIYRVYTSEHPDLRYDHAIVCLEGGRCYDQAGWYDLHDWSGLYGVDTMQY